jgi:hypothetical protein
MRFLNGLFRSLFACLVLVGLFAAYRLYFGKPLGGGCADTNDCRELFHVQCMRDPTGSYCTRQCRVQADCPDDWRCINAHAPDGTSLPDMVCSRLGAAVPGSPARPAVRRR